MNLNDEMKMVNEVENLALLKVVALAENDIKKGRVTTSEELFKRLDKKYMIGGKTVVHSEAK